MSDVKHIEMPTASLFAGKNVALTTRNESYSGPTPVAEKMAESGNVALWGATGDFPKRVIEDKRRTPLVAAVIERKVNLLISGGLTYGRVVIDEYTGQDRMVPMREKHIEKFKKDINHTLYLRESANDWYTFYNVFAEFQMGRGYDRVVGMGIQDASDVRLGTMNDDAEITRAYIADWNNGATEADAFQRPALDPYYNVATQLLDLKQAKSILPIRVLNDGDKYYGLAPWDGLRANGTIDIANRINDLKRLLLDNIMHIRYHIEADERYWPTIIPGYSKMEKPAQIAAMKKHVEAIDEWAKGKGQAGAFMSMMLGHGGEANQTSLLRITEKKMTIPDGAYIEDSQETHFIICRDMGLKPGLHGISPSKSGSSPGSGSEERMARTSHILDCKSDQDMILKPFEVVRDVNGWDEDIVFWFANYYAATLDRTNQVDGKPNQGQER